MKLRLCRGFTLIELLVVIAIIAILAGMIFPVFSKAWEAARKAVCISQMKQTALALLMYMDDWDEKGPSHYTDTAVSRPYWTWWTLPYSSFEKRINDPVFASPTYDMAKNVPIKTYLGTKGDASWSTICPNTKSTATWPYDVAYYGPMISQRSIAEIRNPSGTILLVEQGFERITLTGGRVATPGNIDTWVREPMDWSVWWGTFPPGSVEASDLSTSCSYQIGTTMYNWGAAGYLAEALMYRALGSRQWPNHGTMTNVAFLDGHVKTIPAVKLNTSMAPGAAENMWDNR